MTTTANGCIPYKVVEAWIIQSTDLSFRPLTSLLCLLFNVSPTTLLSYPGLYSRISKVAMFGKWVKYPAKFWRMIPFNAVVVSGLPKNLPNRYTWDAQQFPRVILVPLNGSHWVPSKRLGMLLKALKYFYSSKNRICTKSSRINESNPLLFLIINSYPHNSSELIVCLAHSLASFSLTTLPSISSLSTLILPSIKH